MAESPHLPCVPDAFVCVFDDKKTAPLRAGFQELKKRAAADGADRAALDAADDAADVKAAVIELIVGAAMGRGAPPNAGGVLQLSVSDGEEGAPGGRSKLKPRPGGPCTEPLHGPRARRSAAGKPADQSCCSASPRAPKPTQPAGKDLNS